jgi:hypothetical protein
MDILKQAGSLPYNRAMTNLEIIVPFALLPAEHAKDLLAALQAPALARLLARARILHQRSSEGFAPSLPHEQKLADFTDNSPPIALAAMRQLGLSATTGHWFLLQPANLYIARDHLVLTDLRQLELSETESRQLFDAAVPLFTELGLTLLYGNAGSWLLRADDWHRLRTCTPDAACGHNIDIWLPRGEGERAWRKLQNELQMLWHTHPINDDRAQRGVPRINTVWLWGGTPPNASATVPPGLALLARAALGDSVAPTAAELGPGQVRCRNDLIGPALAGDWSSWLAAFAQLDAQFFAPLADALNAGRIDSPSLIFTDSSRLVSVQASRSGMRKFWLAPSLTRLIS